MGNVIDFRILRIQNELDKYAKTKTIPGMMLDGAYSVEDIFEKFYNDLPKKYKMLADVLEKEYYSNLKENQVQLREALRNDYTYVMASLRTEHDSFVIPEVMRKYRKGMNPVRALYYDAREIFRGYNADDPVHHLIIDLITDPEYNNIIINALEKDVFSLEKVIKRYYIPLTTMSSNIPLELFHARQTIKDFQHYQLTFRDARSWNPDE